MIRCVEPAASEPAASPRKARVVLPVAVSGTGTVAVSGHVTGKGHAGGLTGELDDNIGIAVGGSVARTVVRVSRTACPVAEGTGKAGMR